MKCLGSNFRSIRKHTSTTLAARRFRTCGVAVFLSILSASASAAGSVANATVTAVVPESAGTSAAYFVYVSVAPTGAPSCATTTTNQHRFAIDPTTPVGMSMVATALTAYATQATIDVVGLGTCAVWSDTETIERIMAH